MINGLRPLVKFLPVIAAASRFSACEINCGTSLPRDCRARPHLGVYGVSTWMPPFPLLDRKSGSLLGAARFSRESHLIEEATYGFFVRDPGNRHDMIQEFLEGNLFIGAKGCPGCVNRRPSPSVCPRRCRRSQGISEFCDSGLEAFASGLHESSLDRITLRRLAPFLGLEVRQFH